MRLSSRLAASAHVCCAKAHEAVHTVLGEGHAYFGLSQPNVPAVAGRGGSGMTYWQRLRDWQQDGIWDLTHFALLDWLSRDGQIDWSRAVVDSCSVRAVFGGG